MMTMNTLFRPGLLALAALVGTSAMAQTARVQVIHNSADLAASVVDIYLDATLLFDDVPFRFASPFVDAPAGVQFTVGIAPGNSTSSAQAIYTEDFTLAANETYVIVASGIVSPSGYTPATPFSLSVYPMGRESASNAANTDVLVFHGCTDAPTVDVYESGVLGVTAVDDISYGDYTMDYLELPTNDYTLEVRTSDNSTIVAAYAAPLATLNLQGASLVVVASGFLDPSQNSNGPAFGLWAALPTGGPLVELPSAAIPTARVQVIHNSADLAASTVDVWLNNTLLLDDFDFRTASPFVDAQAGVDLTVGIAPSNSTMASDAIAQFNYNLAADETYIIVANGIVSGSGYTPNQPFDLYVAGGAREAATSGASNTDILVFHGSTDAPTVSVAETAVLGGAILVSDLSYGEFPASGYLEVPTGDYVMQIQSGGSPLVSYSAPLSTLSLDGAAITVLASGFLDPMMNSNGPSFGLWVALASGGPLVELPISTGINDQDLISNTALYPNPATDQFFLEVMTKEEFQSGVLLTDMTGRTVRDLGAYQWGVGENRMTFDLNGIAAGTYQLSIVGDRFLRTIPVQVVR